VTGNGGNSFWAPGGALPLLPLLLPRAEQPPPPAGRRCCCVWQVDSL